MANIYETMNVRQKLAKARLYFLNQKVKKSGKNMKLEFKYFELEDIVPPALRIFARVGLVTSTNFDGEKAIMTVMNTDNPREEGIQFVAPYREAGQIISKVGNEVTNPIQALGASITYLRRYLWMMALDITEPDDVDPNLGSEEPTGENEDGFTTPPQTTKKAPATPQERAAAKEELTSTDGAADEAQITELKQFCKDLMEKDESMEDFVQQIAMKTDGFTNITASACTELVKNLKEMIEQYGE